jgi:hypothetical protein
MAVALADARPPFVATEIAVASPAATEAANIESPLKVARRRFIVVLLVLSGGLTSVSRPCSRGVTGGSAGIFSGRWEENGGFFDILGGVRFLEKSVE